MLLSWVWVPGKRVGPFQFGEKARIVVEKYGLIKLEADSPVAYWETYAVPEYESRVFVENGEVVSVLCGDSLVYEGVELLGLPLGRVREVLGQESQLEKNVGVGDAVYHDRLGLTLWIANGVVRTATCDPLEPED